MIGGRVLALDLSVANTGVARAVIGVTTAVSANTWTPGKLRGHERRRWLMRQLVDTVTTFRPDIVVIEWLPRGAGGKASMGALMDLAGLHTLVEYYLTSRVPVVYVHPTGIKTYALGKGSGAGTDKDAVLLAVERRYGDLVQIVGNDQADALTLLAMALHYYGSPLASVPVANTRRLNVVCDLEGNSIDWPVLSVEAS
jgi:Holliday junction resolvasome RuvABC endonuclease subunit